VDPNDQWRTVDIRRRVALSLAGGGQMEIEQQPRLADFGKRDITADHRLRLTEAHGCECEEKQYG
jgi:hypothetical protein